MRPPRLRFTVRRLMVAVAIAACVLFAYRWLDVPTWLARLEKRSNDFAQQAVGHAGKDRYFSQLARQIERTAVQQRPTGQSEPSQVTQYLAYSARRNLKFATNLRGLAAYHKRLMRKYQWAAAHPWLPVFSDPIPPNPNLPRDPSAPVPPPALEAPHQQPAPIP